MVSGYKYKKENASVDHIEKVLFCLPEEYRKIFNEFFASDIMRESATEIRFRAVMPSSVTCSGKNISVFGGREIILTESEMTAAVTRLCEESVHTYSATINEGYIVLSDGLRIGVCGKAVSDGKNILGIREITSVSVRIPHIIPGVCQEIIPLIMQKQKINGALIYSAPGVGKTTLIRDVARTISSFGKRRVAVVDSRGEIYVRKMFAHSLCDFLDGYPKGRGIEIATRTMSPEAVVCDEIGDGDCDGILCAQNTGVPLIATAHGTELSALLRRPGIKKLYEADVFRYYIGLSRSPSEKRFFFDIKDTGRKNV